MFSFLLRNWRFPSTKSLQQCCGLLQKSNSHVDHSSQNQTKLFPKTARPQKSNPDEPGIPSSVAPTLGRFQPRHSKLLLCSTTCVLSSWSWTPALHYELFGAILQFLLVRSCSGLFTLTLGRGRFQSLLSILPLCPCPWPLLYRAQKSSSIRKSRRLFSAFAHVLCPFLTLAEI